MKEKRSVKRFDLISVLAVLAVVLVLLFEGIFVFELYHIRFEPLDRLLELSDRTVSEEEGMGSPAPADSDSLSSDKIEEPASSEDEEPVPVG